MLFRSAGKEEGVKDIIDKIIADITAAGCRHETTQKMDKRSFSRVADKRFSSGFYVNVIFEGKPGAISALRSKFALNEDIFRVLFTEAAAPKEAAPATA